MEAITSLTAWMNSGLVRVAAGDLGQKGLLGEGMTHL
jgi:hypothetical protein